MTTVYTRRVSFDSLNPESKLHDVDQPIHIPLQYRLKPRTPQPERPQLDLDFGYSSHTKHTDVMKVFSSISEIHKPTSTPNKVEYVPNRSKRAPKLPPPPEKSILKINPNHEDNEDNSSKESPIRETSTDKNYTLLNGGSSFQDLINKNSGGVNNNSPRKKSIVEMTPDELDAMDQQFRTGVDLHNMKFGGDGYLPFHNLSSIDSKKPDKDLGKLFGNLKATKRALRPSLYNYHSYTINYRHQQMTTFIEQFYNNEENSGDDNDLNNINTSVSGKDGREKTTRVSLPYNLRELLIYISGKKHTWDSIDWALKNYSQDGDHLILISRIPNDDKVYDVALIKSKAQELMDYVLKSLKNLGKADLKASVTIDLIKDNDVKNMIKNSVNLYNPNFLFISTLITTRLNQRLDGIVKLPTYILKHIEVPLIIIPHETGNDNKNHSDANINTEDNDEHIEDEEYRSAVTHKDFYVNKLAAASDTIFDDYTNHIDNDNDSISSTADHPQDFFPNGFSNPNSANLSKKSSNNSIYKVKSLLDSEDPLPETIHRSRTAPSPFDGVKKTNSYSNSIKPVTSSSSVKKVKSTPATTVSPSPPPQPAEKKKSKGFLSVFGLKKK